MEKAGVRLAYLLNAALNAKVNRRTSGAALAHIGLFHLRPSGKGLQSSPSRSAILPDRTPAACLRVPPHPAVGLNLWSGKNYPGAGS